ncbi:hypothetical protein XPA_009612 [Xanthoria parietina]
MPAEWVARPMDEMICFLVAAFYLSPCPLFCFDCAEVPGDHLEKCACRTGACVRGQFIRGQYLRIAISISSFNAKPPSLAFYSIFRRDFIRHSFVRLYINFPRFR